MTKKKLLNSSTTKGLNFVYNQNKRNNSVEVTREDRAIVTCHFSHMSMLIWYLHRLYLDCADLILRNLVQNYYSTTQKVCLPCFALI